MIENYKIYQFSSDDIKLAYDNCKKAYNSIDKDEYERFNETFGAVITLCHVISRPVDFIERYGLGRYKEVLQTHHQMGTIILEGKKAKIALDGKKRLDEITKPKFREDQYKSDDNVKRFNKAINPYYQS